MKRLNACFCRRELILLVTFFCLPLNLRADNIFSNWTDGVQATGWETGAAFGTMTALGLFSWEWGSSTSFRWHPEGVGMASAEIH
ncbi:hypothetical protein [Prosthecochloris vibrioformis]|uniref:Uncharacterized protein n=1 Tax=Prosthecochloris vibrioformis TaxID=1098 RepID=A0A5C4RZB4_PROVB|nr:hypothetical protein [Prosthecochloris vibrioformis]TNJ36258.1 hypothetical protein FGF68_08475 [Prosthecochloris vibrioformis]